MIPSGNEIDLSSWISGIAVLVSLIAAAVALFSSHSANKIAKKNLSASVELEIIRFREQWIQRLRNEMSSLAGLLTCNTALDKASEIELEKHYAQVLLLMNPKDVDYEILLTKIVGLKRIVDSRADETNHAMDYVDICQRILKREWDRLKSDVEQYKED